MEKLALVGALYATPVRLFEKCETEISVAFCDPMAGHVEPRMGQTGWKGAIRNELGWPHS